MAIANLFCDNNFNLKCSTLDVKDYPLLVAYAIGSGTPAVLPISSGSGNGINLSSFLRNGDISSPQTNNITINLTGKYEITIQTTWIDNGVNAAAYNRILYVDVGSERLMQINSKVLGLSANSGQYTPVSFTYIAALVDGNILSFNAYQNSGSNLNILTGLGDSQSVGVGSPNTFIQIKYLCP